MRRAVYFGYAWPAYVGKEATVTLDLGDNPVVEMPVGLTFDDGFKLRVHRHSISELHPKVHSIRED